MPPSAPSAHVSDQEEDPDEDEDNPEVEDAEILADLPDDTDVRPTPSTFTKARNHRSRPFYVVSFV
jgi:hypothetical protein